MAGVCAWMLSHGGGLLGGVCGVPSSVDSVRGMGVSFGMRRGNSLSGRESESMSVSFRMRRGDGLRVGELELMSVVHDCDGISLRGDDGGYRGDDGAVGGIRRAGVGVYGADDTSESNDIPPSD